MVSFNGGTEFIFNFNHLNLWLVVIKWRVQLELSMLWSSLRAPDTWSRVAGWYFRGLDVSLFIPMRQLWKGPRPDNL